MGGKQCIKVWTITYKEISLSPTALKIFKRSSLQRLQILSVLGDTAYFFNVLGDSAYIFKAY
jgi:hypothetical protein